MIISTMNSKKGKDAPFDVRIEASLDETCDLLAGLEVMLDFGHGGKRRTEMARMAAYLRLVTKDVTAKAARQ